MSPSSLSLASVSFAALTLILQCLAAPASSPPHEHIAHHSPSHLQIEQPASHLLDDRLSSPHNPHSADVAGSSHTATFDQDLDAFLNQYSHKDLDFLIPLPDNKPAAFKQPDAHQQHVHSSSSQQSQGESQHSTNMYLHSPGSFGTPQSQSPPRSASPGTNHLEDGSAVPQHTGSMVDGNAWRGQASRQHTHFYQGGALSHAVTRSATKGAHKIVPDVLSNKFARQDVAAPDVREISKKKADGIRFRLLGSDADAITARFAQHHNIGYEKARKLLNRRLGNYGKYSANLLKSSDPKKFERGARILRPHPAPRKEEDPLPIRTLIVRHQEAVKAGEASSAGTAQEGSSGGKKRKNIQSSLEGVMSLAEQAHQAKRFKNGKPLLGTAQAKRLQIQEHAEMIIPPPIESRMAVVYRDHVVTHTTTAHNYVRKAISEHPEGAIDLAEDLLSADVSRINAATERIGRPTYSVSKSYAEGSKSTLPDAVAAQVEFAVMRARKVGRLRARAITKKALTPEMARNLQDPATFQSALDSLLASRLYKGITARRHGSFQE